MKLNSEQSDTFLSEWLEGRISDHELKGLVSEKDFEAYLILRNSLKALSLPEPDIEQNFRDVKSKLSAPVKKETKVVPLFRYAAIAAAVVILFGLYGMLVFSSTAETSFGQASTVTLPDNSIVKLNSKTRIAYAPLFRYNRIIKLSGEAFFDVEKGSTFCVETDFGDVKVLGTEFNVIAREGFFEVSCYEGKVEVKSDYGHEILTAGNSVRFVDGKMETWTTIESNAPLWLNGESGFKNAPFSIVMMQFDNHYKTTAKYPEEIANTRFTGSFTHKDIETALKSLCIPLGLAYKISPTGEILISE